MSLLQISIQKHPTQQFIIGQIQKLKIGAFLQTIFETTFLQLEYSILPKCNSFSRYLPGLV